jgi:hypothetical protein
LNLYGVRSTELVDLAPDDPLHPAACLERE